MHVSNERLTTVPGRTAYMVLLLCWGAILSEGYDVGVMGTIIPVLSVDPSWHLSSLQIGAMSSAALVGTLFGASFISVFSDLAGRKRPLIGCVILFSLSMLAAAWAPTPHAFAIARLIGGLGLGGLIPVAAALTVEYSPPHRRNLNFALMYSGYPLGALVSALTGMGFMAEHGWRPIVAIGATSLLFVPFMMAFLPESLDFLLAKNRTREATALVDRLRISRDVLTKVIGPAGPRANVRAVLAEMFSKHNASSTILLGIAQFTAMIVIYGLGTWLPQIMHKSGYDLGSSLCFLVVFSLSSAIGGVAIGRIADRFGPRLTISSAFLFGAIGIVLLAFKNTLIVNYILVACAGFGSIGVALVLLGYIASYYEPHARGTATGCAVIAARLGAMTGPLIGGYIGGLGVGKTWNFVAFSLAALIAALVVFLTPQPASMRRAARSLDDEAESAGPPIEELSILSVSNDAQR
jgi:AAHS family benzoate transporter-like MFS transporter